MHLRDFVSRALESDPLLGEQRRFRVVSGGEVRVDRVEVQIPTGEQAGQCPFQVVEAKPEPVHAGVDFEVIPQTLVVFLSRGLHRTSRAGRRDGWRQTAVEQAIEIADAERPEHEDVGVHAGRSQHGAFFDVGARQQIRARRFERERHLSRAVTVGVRLDDGNDSRRARRTLRTF